MRVTNPTEFPVLAELGRITEATAVAVGPFIGKEDKIGADGAAVEAIGSLLAASSIIQCRVAIGEGEKDEAPMLQHGLVLGNGDTMRDLAVDPVEGTTRTSEGRDGGMVLMALGHEGDFLPWLEEVPYMKKLVVGPDAACTLGKTVGLEGDPRENLREIAYAMGRPVGHLRVAVLERERNAEIIEGVEAVGATLISLDSGDVLPAIQASTKEDEAVHVLYSSGGSPEAVLTAAVVAGLGGNMQAVWDPQNNIQKTEVSKLSPHQQQICGLDGLVGNGDVFFAATAITDGPFLDGVSLNKETGLWELGANPTLLTYRGALSQAALTHRREPAQAAVI